MVDRPHTGPERGHEIEIDALLIGALYGELSPAEQAQLTAHLETHPADRAALADLTHARELVRENRLLQVQLDPPPSVSALLMQEAARRAPRAPGEGWFARFVHSFMAHPAMAAAAMLVVVVGVAAMVSRRGGEPFATSTAPSSAPMSEVSRMGPPPSADRPVGGEAAPTATATGDADGRYGAEGAKDQYPVSLDDGFAAPDVEEGKADRAKGTGRGAPAAVKPSPKLRKQASGIEVRTQQASPKDFDSAPTRTKDASSSFDYAQAPQPSGAALGGVGAPSPPPRPAAPATVAREESADKKAPTRAAAPSAPADNNATESKPADPQLAWARGQHKTLIAEVRAGDCRSAAGVAVNLANRVPSYYAQNVENDRQLRQCLAYINTERERDTELRAARARATQKPSAEPPKRAADQPATPTTDRE